MILSFTVRTLSNELDTLRNNICNSCRKKLVSTSNVSVPTLALSGPSKSASALPSLWHRAFQGRQGSRPSTDNPLHRGPSSSPAVSLNNSTSSKLLAPVPSEPEFAHTPRPSKSIPSSNEKAIVSSEAKAEVPKCSVEYHAEAKGVLEINMEKVITYSSAVYCVRMSPNGHSLAIGLYNGTTYLNDLKTGSNIWLVPEPLVLILEI